ncbi:MAG TPA: MarR family transcriptional regulator [Rhizomicrobium sp.]|jgi:DNA-binding MarR family transcriptional regulator
MARRTAALDAADYRLLAEFRHVLRAFLAFSETAAARLGLSSQQHQALLAIKGNSGGPMAVGELANRLAIQHNSAVGLVNRLVQARYVMRQSDPSDRRRACLCVTSSGEALLEKLTAAHRAELRRVVPLLRPLLNQLQR